MKETYYAGAYWLARSESAEACAHRAERFFQLLGRCDPAWNRWHQTAGSFEEARKRQLDTDAASFQKLFSQKKHRILDGFLVCLWAGDDPRELSGVDVSCGSSSLQPASSCILRPFDEGPIGERVLTAPVMAEVLRAMALAWEPELGVVTSHAHRDMVVKGFPYVGTFVGWVMYFSRQRGAVPPLPAPVRVEPVEDKGTLVILTPERFTASNPEHVALAARVHELLNEAGLLARLRPFAPG
ncbi:immunity 52 family protein [Archangium sp.]|jgi:hypothetical protein|uniref:immunity 52 family protein n=1 Tax=Archangium sp. TaxID=1872627 RepID=UPI002EDA6DC4